MLVCGIFWAYIIGALVDTVSSLGSVNKEYTKRMSEVNQMVGDFIDHTLPSSQSGRFIETKVPSRVRRFITIQRNRTTTLAMPSKSALTLEEKYPSLTVMTPELRKICALHLTHSLIESVPYFSSMYMSPDEQSYIALNSYMMDFSVGEKFRVHDELGRGILVFMQGFGVAARHLPVHLLSREFHCRKSYKNRPIDVSEVLLEDDYYEDAQLFYHFLGFAKVFFIPRDVIMKALEDNDRAWKECARWNYMSAALVLRSLEARQLINGSVTV